MQAKALVIGTRASPLALWQAEHVAELLRQEGASAVRLEKISTKGDQILDRSLMDVGGKGLFLKEIEEALLEKRIDLAVHSMKDMPHTLPVGLTIAAVLPREDPRDAFIGRDCNQLDDLPPKARVGTSSLRRTEQLRKIRPDLDFQLLRGNVETRLQKLDAGEYDAVILAAAGLGRLGLSERIGSYLPIVPAVAQGAIGVECRTADLPLKELLQPLNDERTLRCVLLERKFLSRVQGDCHTPMGCYVMHMESDCNLFVIHVYYMNISSGREVTLSDTGSWDAQDAVIERMAERALAVC